jgi:hypothetical protein
LFYGAVFTCPKEQAIAVTRKNESQKPKPLRFPVEGEKIQTSSGLKKVDPFQGLSNIEVNMTKIRIILYGDSLITEFPEADWVPIA